GADYQERGLRLWTNEDVVPSPEDVFQERLYCIRWIQTREGTKADGATAVQTSREYAAPTPADFEREQRVLELLRKWFGVWQRKGFLPTRRIEPGAKTDEPIRTRGWTHWQHLFNPRQLLIEGLFARESLDGNATDAVS